MLRRNTAGQSLLVGPLLDAATGAAVTAGASVDVAKDGAAAVTGSGTLAHMSNGCWWYNPTQAETDGATVGIVIYKSGAIPSPLTVLTTRGDPQDATRFGLSALPNAAAGAVNGLPLLNADAAAGFPTVPAGVQSWGAATPQTAFNATAGALLPLVAAQAVSDPVTVGQNNDKAGYTLAASAINRATFTADTGLQSVRSGTAAGGSANTVTLDGGANVNNNYYKGCLVMVTSGVGSAQAPRLIAAYDGATKVATVTPPWVTAPTGGSTFAVIAQGQVDVEAWRGAQPNPLLNGRIDADAQSVADKAGYALSAAGLDLVVPAEPTAVPAWGASVVGWVGWLGALASNYTTQTATTQTLRNRANTLSVASRTVADDGTTFTAASWA